MRRNEIVFEKREKLFFEKILYLRIEMPAVEFGFFFERNLLIRCLHLRRGRRDSMRLRVENSFFFLLSAVISRSIFARTLKILHRKYHYFYNFLIV